MASRILGMGDVMTLIERLESSFDQEQAQKMEQKLRRAEFDLEDFLEQLGQVQQMGSMSQIMEMVPGMGKLAADVSPEEAERQLRHIEAIILSMTPEERRNPRVLNGSRKRRIARGSGTTVQDVNALLSQYRQMKRMIKQLSRQKGSLRGLMGGMLG
jgi:signal recognition particle subunit SRP54